MVLRPFEQLPFDRVPEHPRVPHDFFEARQERVQVDAPGFGPVEVRVVRHGVGPTLVLVHGFMTSSYSFRYLFQPLAREFSLVAFDLVGSGDSAKPPGSYHPDALARFIVATVDALEVRGARVIGNSLGGYLCMRAAMLDATVFSRLVCLHAPGLPTPRMRALRLALDLLPRAPEIVRWLVRRDPERWVHRNVHYWDETLKSREEHREYARPLRDPAGLAAFVRTLDETLSATAMREFESSLRALGGHFPIPLELVYAERDPMVPPAVGRRLCELLPSAEMVWLSQASHFAHVDAPQAFLAAALPFLRG